MPRPGRSPRAAAPARLVVCLWLAVVLATAARAEGASPAPGPSPSPGRSPAAWRPVTDGTAVWGLIVALSVASAGLIVDHFLTIRRGRLLPAPAYQELDAKVRARHLDDVARYAQDPRNESLLTRVVLAGVERYRQNPAVSQAEVRAAAQEEGQEQVARLGRRTEALGAIGVVAPLLGLLGTVQSLITSLDLIAAAGDAARPADLAAATSRALVIAAWGLLVAVPALAAQSVFRARVDGLAAEAGKQAGQILQPLGRP